jgi:RES domain-containing protein
MATFYRIVQSQWSASAMTGEGARLHGGRWNPPGLSAVYLAESRALAALEILVHAPREALALNWDIIDLAIPEHLIRKVSLAALPADWRALPSSPGARHFGGEWLKSLQSPALLLPSTIIPEEHLLLVNPLHPDATTIQHTSPKPFVFDPRCRF